MKTKSMYPVLFRKILPLIMAALLFTGVMASCGEKTVKVPSCIGATREEAEQSLKSAGVNYSVETTFSDTVEAGLVVDQSFDAGSEISSSETMALIVSSGKQITYPDLIGKTRADAEEALKYLGLELVVGSEEYNNSVDKGCVIRQDKKAGDKAEKGDKVSVVISKGVRMVKVPDVKGQTLSAAKKKLSDAKLKYKVKRAYSSSVSKDKIIRQNKAGESVKINSTITLVVSKGKKPQPQSSSSQADYTPEVNDSTYNYVPSNSSSSATPSQNPEPVKPTIEY